MALLVCPCLAADWQDTFSRPAQGLPWVITLFCLLPSSPKRRLLGVRRAFLSCGNDMQLGRESNESRTAPFLYLVFSSPAGKNKREAWLPHQTLVDMGVPGFGLGCNSPFLKQLVGLLIPTPESFCNTQGANQFHSSKTCPPPSTWHLFLFYVQISATRTPVPACSFALPHLNGAGAQRKLHEAGCAPQPPQRPGKGTTGSSSTSHRLPSGSVWPCSLSGIQ